MVLHQIELFKDGTPKMIRGAYAQFLCIEENNGKVYLYALEDAENKPQRTWYFSPMMENIDSAKWQYFDSVKVDGRIKLYFMMEG